MIVTFKESTLNMILSVTNSNCLAQYDLLTTVKCHQH